MQLSFARYELLMLLSFTRQGCAAHGEGRRPAAGAPGERDQRGQPAGGGRAGASAVRTRRTAAPCSSRSPRPAAPLAAEATERLNREVFSRPEMTSASMRALVDILRDSAGRPGTSSDDPPGGRPGLRDGVRPATAADRLAGPVAHRGARGHRSRPARRSHRLVHPPGRPRRGARPRDEEPRPGRRRRPRAGPGRRQPGGEPPAGRRPAARRRHPGVGDRHRVPGRGTPVDAPALRRRPRRGGAGLADRRGRRVGPAGTGSGAAGRRPDLARPVDGGRLPHVHRRPAPRLGLVNAFGSSGERYPRVELDELRSAGADVVLLPDEPYVFTADDGPEAFPGTPSALVSGRALTWYGPSLVTARADLTRQIRDTASAPPDAGPAAS